MDLFVYWYVLPVVIVAISLHGVYMLIDQRWTFSYDGATLKESLLITLLWPIGASIVIMVLYTYVQAHIERLWSDWRKRRGL